MALVVTPTVPLRPPTAFRPPGGRPPVAPIDPSNYWKPPADWWYKPVVIDPPWGGPPLKIPLPWTDWAQNNSRPPQKTVQPHLPEWNYGDGTKVFDCKLRIHQLERTSQSRYCESDWVYKEAVAKTTYNDMSFLRVTKISFTGGSSMTVFRCGNGPPEYGPETTLYRVNYTLESGKDYVHEVMGGGATFFQNWYGMYQNSFRVNVLEVDGKVYAPTETKPTPLPPDYFPPPWEPPAVEPAPAERPMVPPAWVPPGPAAPPIAPPDAPQDPGQEAPPRPVPPGQPGRPGTDTGTGTGPGTGPGTGGGGGGGGGDTSVPDAPPGTKPAETPTPQPPGWPYPPVIPAPVPTPKPDPIPDWMEDFLGEPIGHPSERPQETAKGTATMLGKLEQKLRILGNKLPQGPGGGGGTDWGDLLQLLGQLLSAPYPAGEYQLGNACKPDQDPVKVTWAAGVGEFSELRARVDALAALIDEHKKMGQPVCIKERQGQPVTVILREKR